jgi:N-acetylglucosaminyl-diphospho-decaprenol L-rhamnosyltransferase
MADVSIIVVSHNARHYVERSLSELRRSGHELILVDSASADGTVEMARERFPDVRILTCDDNGGYGAAANAGIEIASGRWLLVMNGDAWPVAGAVDALVDFGETRPGAGIVGPRLVNPDGSLQPSVRGFPTLWRLATEYLFLRWFAPGTRALNSFYGAGFDHESIRDAEFLVGAVLLIRRDALDEVGAFDTSFFMFNEEVDLCYRVLRAGMHVVFFPGAEFAHVGGASTRPVWPAMYREQLRSHLRFLWKHHGPAYAERGRRLLVLAMRLRSVVLRGERRRLSRDAAAWLRAGDVPALLGHARG